MKDGRSSPFAGVFCVCGIIGYTMSVTLREATRPATMARTAVKFNTSRELLFAALAALAIAVAIVGFELATKSIYVSGFTIVALLVASIGFFATSQVAKHR